MQSPPNFQHFLLKTHFFVFNEEKKIEYNKALKFKVFFYGILLYFFIEFYSSLATLTR